MTVGRHKLLFVKCFWYETDTFNEGTDNRDRKYVFQLINELDRENTNPTASVTEGTIHEIKYMFKGVPNT